MAFSRDVLRLDAGSTARQIQTKMQEFVRGTLRRRGLVVGLSGGIDSSVVAALAANALGKERVLGLFMPERDSSDDAMRLGKMLADHLGIEAIIENIGPTLEGAGCYARQEQAIRTVFPEYGAGHKCKITLPSILESERLNVFQLTVMDPSGKTQTSRMPPAAYLTLVAATNFKQRVR